jgi:hypothetical protein
MPVATQLLCQPLRQVVPEATGINEIFSRLGHVKGGALECDHRFYRRLHRE